MVKCWAWKLDSKKDVGAVVVEVIEEVTGWKKVYYYPYYLCQKVLWVYDMISEITKKRDRDFKKRRKK